MIDSVVSKTSEIPDRSSIGNIKKRLRLRPRAKSQRGATQTKMAESYASNSEPYCGLGEAVYLS